MEATELYESGRLGWRVAAFFVRSSHISFQGKEELQVRLQRIIEIRDLEIYIALKIRHPLRAKLM